LVSGCPGTWDVVSLTDTGDRSSDCADITEAYGDFADPESPLPPGIVPLMDRGCAMWALIGFRTADGQMWDRDPTVCCAEHALAPLGQSPAEWLTDWLHGTMPEGSYPKCELTESDRSTAGRQVAGAPAVDGRTARYQWPRDVARVTGTPRRCRRGTWCEM
jgi:hypothetical protein